MVKNMFIGIFLLTASLSFAQQKEDFIRAGLLKADVAFNQSFMLQHKSKNVYLSGNMEYYTGKNLSFRGDCFWYLDSRKANAVLKRNAIILFGALLHMPKGRSDFFAGLQPGISITQPTTPTTSETILPLRMLPAISITLGYNLYFSKLCNFFIAANYLTSRYRGASNSSLRLDEFMISGGLGFHIQTKRLKS